MGKRAVKLFATVAVVVGIVAPVPGTSATASHPQLDPDITKMPYRPIGHFGPAVAGGVEPLLPATSDAGDPAKVPLNPSGDWVAYDTNVYESINLPSRHPGDTTTDDPPGNGGAPYGFCNHTDPTFVPWGRCETDPASGNHQLEYLDYFEAAMEEILGDFGVTVRRYEFESPGSGSRGLFLDAAGGRAFNISATVPGADHPEESVLVSGHYDFTDSGPAAAWDSSEGHASVIRIAKIMADYWRATGTRPSATVKFIPWDSEESGTFGSLDYVQNNIPPGEENKVRAYFNMDPCAGAYPAFRNGNPLDRVPEVLQLANPAGQPAGPARDRIVAFNQRAETIVDQVFDNLDDRLFTAPGEPEIFVSDAEAAAGANGGVSQRGEIVTAVGGLFLFTSDYRNFEALGIPIFNLFPDYFGLHADGTPGQNDGIGILHTPRDNLTTINALTSADQTGLQASEGWAKGMEMCSQIEGWYMLQPEMGGAQTATGDAVAYFEALPNEAIANQAVNFDASGSYQYADVASRALVDDADLTFAWDFGDGTAGSGRVVSHSYAEIGRYDATLTVTGVGGSSDTMTIPITVVGSSFQPPDLDPIDPADAADGDFGLSWTYEGTREGLSHFSVEESTDLTTLLFDDAEGAITDNWVVEQPSDPRVQPWQRSDSGTSKWMGNKRHSGQASLWTGVTPEDSNPAPAGGRSVLRLKGPIPLPQTTAVELQYWSLFKNQSVDRGRVEVAVDDGDPATEPEWEAVQVLGGPDDTFVPGDDFDLELRRVNLGGFAGRDVLLRFVFQVGGDPILSQPAGWYIDDVRLQAGTFDEIGTTTEETFQVAGRANGSYAYRVVGVFNDGVRTAPSNTETAEVTEAKPDLLVAEIGTDKATGKPKEGEKVTITATIANEGGEAAGPSSTEFLLDGQEVLGLVDTPAIPAGGSTEVSVGWDTRGVKGEHEIRVTADRGDALSESDEGNNSSTLAVEVRGNKVRNGSFEQANADGSGPSSWEASDTAAGTTEWSDGGSHGAKSASVQGTGGSAALDGSPTWTSDPIAVEAGETLTLAVSVQSDGTSSPASAGLVYLGGAGELLDAVTLFTAPLTTDGFATLEQAVKVPLGVAEVRVVLTGFSTLDASTAGTVTFDEVGLFGG